MDQAAEEIIACFKYGFPSLLKEAVENLGRISLHMFRLCFTIFHPFAFYGIQQQLKLQSRYPFNFAIERNVKVSSDRFDLFIASQYSSKQVFNTST